jgi:hypothetical protein
MSNVAQQSPLQKNLKGAMLGVGSDAYMPNVV